MNIFTKHGKIKDKLFGEEYNGFWLLDGIMK